MPEWSLLDRSGEVADLNGDGIADGPFDVTGFAAFSPDFGGWQGSFGASLFADGNLCTTQDWVRGNVAKSQLTVTYLSNITPSENLLCSFVLCGDANRDGAVDLLDVANFTQCIVNGGTLNGEFMPECDVNEDGAVDLLDVNPFVAKLTNP